MKTVEEIIATSNYYDLTTEEREMVHELVEDEAQFNEMKAFFSELSVIAPAFNTTPSTSVKSKLDDVFAAKHPSFEVAAKQSAPESKVVPLYKRTWMQIAALFLIVLSVAPFLNFKSDKMDQKASNQFSNHTAESFQTDVNAENVADNAFEKETFVESNTFKRKHELASNATISFAEEDLTEDKNMGAAAPSASWSAGMDADLNPSGYSTDNSTEEMSAAEMLELIQAAY